MEDRQIIMSFDLRVIYAKLVGEHLYDISTARKNQNFYEWFRALQDFWTMTKHNFKKPEAAKVVYDALAKDIIKLAHEYPAVWSKQSSDPQAIAKIDAKLRELEEFLHQEAKNGGVYGHKCDYDPDEI